MAGSGGYTPIARLGRGEIGSLWLAADQADQPVVVAVFEPAEAITIGLLTELATLMDQLSRAGQLRVLAGDRSGSTPWIVAPAADWPAAAGLFLARGRTFLLSPDAGPSVARAIATAPPPPTAPPPTARPAWAPAIPTPAIGSHTVGHDTRPAAPVGGTAYAPAPALSPAATAPLAVARALPGVVVTPEEHPPPDLSNVLDPPWPPPYGTTTAATTGGTALRAGVGVR